MREALKLTLTVAEVLLNGKKVVYELNKKE
jgi:hypothetical protein